MIILLFFITAILLGIGSESTPPYVAEADGKKSMQQLEPCGYTSQQPTNPLCSSDEATQYFGHLPFETALVIAVRGRDNGCCCAHP